MPKENLEGWTAVLAALRSVKTAFFFFCQIVSGLVRTPSKGSQAMCWILLLM